MNRRDFVRLLMGATVTVPMLINRAIVGKGLGPAVVNTMTERNAYIVIFEDDRVGEEDCAALAHDLREYLISNGFDADKTPVLFLHNTGPVTVSEIAQHV